MPLWASWLKDFESLNIFHDELKIEKMAKFEILIATNGLMKILSKMKNGLSDASYLAWLYLDGMEKG